MAPQSNGAAERAGVPSHTQSASLMGQFGTSVAQITHGKHKSKCRNTKSEIQNASAAASDMKIMSWQHSLAEAKLEAGTARRK